MGTVTKLRLEPPSESPRLRDGEASLLGGRSAEESKAASKADRRETCFIRKGIGFRRCLLTRRSALLAVVALAAACTVHQDEVPSLTGPSEFGQSVSISATPDSISQDGASQSAIVVFVRGPNGAGLSGVSLRLQIVVRGSVQDYGTLSAKSIATGSDGRASAIYTAPPAPPPPANGVESRVSIIVTATGSNFQTAVSHTVDIRLVPTGIILPPAQTPNPSFTYSPQPVLVNLPVNFDASATCGGSSCAAAGITSFQWNFGDGSTASGQRTTKTFDSNGSFNVTLTATNDRGVSASTTQVITIGTGAEPTAEFVFSPTAPQVLQTISFNASESRAAAGRTISRYAWNFGDNTPPKTGQTTTHDFGTAGTFNVVLTVTDDLDQKGTASQTVTVIGSGGSAPTTPTARLTFSPAAPAVNEPVFFNGSTSTPGAGHTIASYQWVFGDGTTISGPPAGAAPEGGTFQAPQHRFTASGAYSVQLTVTDETGQSNTAATPITIGNPPPPEADFTFSPDNPPVGQQVVFDASTSTTAQGQTIVDVAWNYGDGTEVVHCGTLAGNHPSCVNVSTTNRISAHTYQFVGVFTVNLVVTDSAGRTDAADPQQISVISPNPRPELFLAKSGGNAIQADGSASTATGTATIVTYRFIWGDSTLDTEGPAASVSHTYVGAGAAGPHTVTLVVTDSLGRTAATSKDITTP